MSCPVPSARLLTAGVGHIRFPPFPSARTLISRTVTARLLTSSGLCRRVTPPDTCREVESSLLMSFQPGTQLGPYRIVSQLGSGGMGVVYQAADPRLKRTVAVKLLPPDLTGDETAKQRFLQEAQAVLLVRISPVRGIWPSGTTI